MSSEVVKKESTEVSTEVNMDIFSGSGFEGMTGDSYAIPMMKIVQALSPVKKKTDPSYNKEADDGQFWDPATGELYDELNIRVLSAEHQLVVWKDRDLGGGLVGKFHKSEERNIVARKEGLKKWDKDGNSVMDTIMFTCMNADDPTHLFYFPMSATSLKYAKFFASKMDAVKVNPETKKLDAENGVKGVASWAVVWNIKTAADSNAKGEWYTIGKTPTAIRTFEDDEIPLIQKALKVVQETELDYGAMENEGSHESSAIEEGF